MGRALTPQCPDSSDPDSTDWVTVTDAKMLMMELLLPRGVLGGYGGDPDGVNDS